jgi:hypothetical protein
MRRGGQADLADAPRADLEGAFASAPVTMRLKDGGSLMFDFATTDLSLAVVHYLLVFMLAGVLAFEVTRAGARTIVSSSLEFLEESDQRPESLILAAIFQLIELRCNSSINTRLFSL